VNVLIVDDDADVREAIGLLLSSEGHHSVAVNDGSQALECLAQGVPVCLILLDLMMPGMNGAEFRARQLLDPKISSIPVVIITADGSAEGKALQLEAAGYLRKPMDAGVLVSTVKKYCPADPSLALPS
jgi:CheY-like chemotaxis protein